MVRSAVIGFKVTPEMRDEIKALARDRGVKPGTFIRMIFELDLDAIKLFVDAAEARKAHDGK